MIEGLKRRVTKYEQLKKVIRGIIIEHGLTGGKKLPSERQLMEHYGVSRTTVRRAISDLVQEGLLRRQGKTGTFVRGSENIYEEKASSSIKLIGLVMPQTSEMSYLTRKMFLGVAEAARLNGYQVVVSASHNSYNREREIVKELVQTGVSGLVIMPANEDYEIGREHIVELYEKGFPLILVDKYFRDLNTDYVITDNETGAYRIVTHLIKLGHRRICFISYPTRGTSIEDKLSGYKKALIEHGLPFKEDLVEMKADDEQRLRLFIRTNTPAAFFCKDDGIAVKTLRVARQEGFRIPEDVAIAGYDDSEVLEYVDIGITTVRDPVYDIGKTAAMKLLKRIRAEVGPSEVQQVVFTPKLIVRESCGSTILAVSQNKGLAVSIS